MTNSKALQDKNKLLDEISKYFDADKVNQIARETKFVQRKSKLTAMDFFFLCVFAHQKDDNISLEGLASELLKDGVDISKQSLQDRFNDKASFFMEKIVNQILAQKLDSPPIIKHSFFNRIVIADSTVFQLPAIFADKYKGCGGGASTAAVKIQYGFDLLSNSILIMLIEGGVNPDNKMELLDVKKTIYG